MRHYLQDPVSEADLNRIAEAGWRASSARKRQPWDFVIVTDRAQLEELSTVWRGAGCITSAAAAIALIVPVPSFERRRKSNSSPRLRRACPAGVDELLAGGQLLLQAAQIAKHHAKVCSGGGGNVGAERVLGTAQRGRGIVEAGVA